MLGGINKKASKYEMSTAQFLDLRNMDFDVPNALQKRPGSTFAIGSSFGTSGPITSLFEFTKLTGESRVILGSDTAMFYINGSTYTLLDPGWNNGQPTDMLTFVNKLWMCNGQHWKSWDGSTLNSPVPVGLPMSEAGISQFAGGVTTAHWYVNHSVNLTEDNSSSQTFLLVGGATWISRGASWNARGVFVAYSYVRSDGYFGPIDFYAAARNIVGPFTDSLSAGQEFFTGAGTLISLLAGFTAPSSYGISAIAVWVGVDYVDVSTTDIEYIPNIGQALVGNLGFVETTSGINARHSFGYTLKPNADLSRFWLYTLIPLSNLISVNVNIGGGASYPIMLGATFVLSSFDAINGAAAPGFGWSGMTTDYFASYIPKYQEISQNVMFTSGFSAFPSTVNFSEIGEPEVIFPENTFEVRTNDGDRVYAVKAFNNQVIVAKEHSFAKIIGSNADEFQLVDLSNDYGCLSNNTVVTKDQLMYWLDRNGILEYNGADWDIISDSIEDVFRRMNISAAKEKAVGVHHMYRNQLWWGIPVDGSTENNLTVIYDYLIQAWTFFDGYSPSSYAYVTGAQNRPTVWRGDYSGMVHYTGESFFSDSGQGITCMGIPRYENVGGENQTTLWRRLFLDIAPITGASTPINVQIFSNYENGLVQATFAIYQNIFQTRCEMGIEAKAVTAQFSHHSASLPLLINGYSWASRGLRNV